MTLSKEEQLKVLALAILINNHGPDFNPEQLTIEDRKKISSSSGQILKIFHNSGYEISKREGAE